MELEKIVEPLILWYQQEGRSLPWRENHDPYRVWLSEIMLQQTRIEAVIPYYHRFLSALPDIKALALCEEEPLLKLWEGLGYYSRARNLQKAAKEIMEHHGGEMPKTAKELKKLPGIGDYTAGAIASIAFGEPSPAVDGNVLRVLSRLLCDRRDMAAPSAKKEMEKLLAPIYPKGEAAGTFTQGLMELGERICLPKGAPKCEECPLKELCEGRKRGEASSLPVLSPKKARRIEEKTVLLLTCKGKTAYLKRPKKGLLAGLWEYPNTEGHLTKAEALEAAENWGLQPASAELWGEKTHVFTHVEWRMIAYTIPCEKENSRFFWFSAEEAEKNIALPTAFSFVRKKTEGRQ